jgi:fluoride exporter
MLQTYIAVMAGGALGVGVRLFLSEWIGQRWEGIFPWGTVLVNISGCLLIGLFVGLTGQEGLWNPSPLVRQVVMVGMLGGFTTFSSFSLQTLQLFSSGHPAQALINVFLTVILCLLATGSGLALSGCFKTG